MIKDFKVFYSNHNQYIIGPEKEFERICTLTKQSLLYLSTFNKRKIYEFFIEIWDLEKIKFNELSLLKIQLHTSRKETLPEVIPIPKFVIKILELVKKYKKTKLKKYYIRFTFKEHYKKKLEPCSLSRFPNINTEKNNKNTIDAENTPYSFPIFIMEASENGLQIISKKIPNKENQKDKTFIDVEITNLEDVSKDPNVKTLELIDKFGKKKVQ